VTKATAFVDLIRGESRNKKVKTSNAMKKPTAFVTHVTHVTFVTLAALLTVLLAGCTMLSYTGPNGERFSRSSLGSSTAISSLVVEADTNGVRHVELRGYTNDSAQALGAVTEAAVRAALQGAR
jgi:hypothetical protein